MPFCLCGSRVTLACTLAVFSIWFGSASAAFCQVPVLTEHNDTFRTGANTNETLLTPANVNATHFGKLFTQSVDGLIVGQPLYVPGVVFPGGSMHNVVYVATQHDSVYAFDADTLQASLWTVSFINPSAGITSVPITDFGCTGTAFNEVGIMSTPVIAAPAGPMYVVAKTLENGAFIYRLHALSLTTGLDVATPAVISASVNTNDGSLQFNPSIQMQRPALLLSDGAIYIAFGSNGCDTFAYHGWVLAYDALSLSQVGAFATTPNGTKGAIWQAGGGLAADTDGTIFFATGNGTFDADAGGPNYSDSFIHLSSASSGLNVLDYFTPHDEQALDSGDLDVGSGGVVLLPDQDGPHTHEVLGGGKAGTIYLVDRDVMGGFNATDDSQIVQSIPLASAGELISVPVYWNGNVYVSGQNDHIRVFSFTGGLLSSQPTSQTAVVFNQAGPGSVSVSSDSGLSNGIVWAMIHNSSASVVYAFDATNLAAQLYNTRQAKLARDTLGGVAHFATPTVTNGKVYVGGRTALYAYGLLPSLSSVAGNHQSGFLGATLPILLTVKATDAYAGQSIANVSVTCKDGGVGGSFSAPVMVTDSQGQASTNYTLPLKLAKITITCTNTAFRSATFSEASVAGPATKILISSGNNQIGPVNTQLPTALTVKVQDARGFGVPGVAVGFSDGGAGGTLSATSVVSGSTGLASTLYTTPGTTGIVHVTTSVSGLTAVVFKVTVQ